jgi:hypothetical protein
MRFLLKTLLVLTLGALLPSQGSSVTIEELKVSNQFTNPYISFRLNDEMAPLNFHLHNGNRYFITYKVENVPFIPDIRASFDRVKSKRRITLDRELKIDDYQLEPGNSVETKVNFKNIDLTFYYQPLNYFTNDYLKVEVGVNLLFFDGTIESRVYTKGGEGLASEDVSSLVPSAHLMFEFQPIYWLAFFTRVGLPLKGDEYEKAFEGGVKVYVNPQLFLTFGYDYDKLKVEDNNVQSLKFSNRGLKVGIGKVW